MATSSSGKYGRIPTRDEIESELTLIWPGWAPEPQGQARNHKIGWSQLPPPWLRRIKWLVKWHELHLRHLTGPELNWGVHIIGNPKIPGKVFCHPVEGRGYRVDDEPAPVTGPPPLFAGDRTSARAPASAAQIAVELRQPLGRVRALLEDCPPGADRLAFVRGEVSA